MKLFDVVIIGSGPAGSAAARAATTHGLSTAVIDKASFPRDKLCGGLFTGRSQKALQDIFGVDVTPDLFLTSTRMRFSASGQPLADIQHAPAMHLTMRRDLDAMLHGLAVESGAEAFLGDAVTQIDLDAGTVALRGGDRFRYNVLIGADGVGSVVARALFGRAFDPEKTAFGLEIETPLAPGHDDAVEIDFDAAEWGYGWSFPKRRTRTVGICGLPPQNPDIKASMSRYVAQVEGDPALSYKGAYLPFGEYKKTPGQGAVLLAGDAAGLVDPITGEGIALAMESGALAAQAAAQAISKNAPQTAMAHYKPLIRPIHKSLDQARLWRLIMFPKATQGHFKKAFARGSHLQMKYLQLLAGEADYADLKWELLRRMPRLAWRFAKHKMGLRQPR